MTECGCHSHNGLLTSRGREVAQRFSLEGLHLRDGVDSRALDEYLDRVGSVSASIEFEFNDSLLEEQYRRFHNGS